VCGSARPAAAPVGAPGITDLNFRELVALVALVLGAAPRLGEMLAKARTLADVAGIAFAPGDLNASGAMVFTGTLADALAEATQIDLSSDSPERELLVPGLSAVETALRERGSKAYQKAEHSWLGDKPGRGLPGTPILEP